jgi:hypothetical protein
MTNHSLHVCPTIIKEVIMSRHYLAWFAAFVLASVVIISGCATIMKGSDQEVRIDSVPSQAKVSVKTMGGVTFWEGVTPARVKVPKKNEYIVTISLQGYKESTVNITQSGIEGWFWGNLLCGGVIGIVVDAVNGAMHKMSPDEISVTLTTASLGNNQSALYAVFHALDNNGELRNLVVPMIKDYNLTAQAR